MIVCATCGVAIDVGRQTCPECTRPPSQKVASGPVQRIAETCPPTIVIHGPDQESGNDVIRVQAPGATSESRLDADGRLSVSVEGAGGVGTSGEGRVKKLLCGVLTEAGTPVSFKNGRDAHGEDGLLVVEDRDLTFQIVTAPSAPDFWRDAFAGSVTTEVDLEMGVAWIEETLGKKRARVSKAQRATTVLAIDAQHAGFLASPILVERFLELHGDPKTSHGWSSVWIVGPIGPYCTRLGSGIP